MADTRLPYLDLLRGLAALGVVLIHATAAALASFTLTPEMPAGFWLLFALNQLARFCVPAFFVLAGFLAAYHTDRPRSTHGRLAQRIFKLAVPYLFWSFIFSLTLNLDQHPATWGTLFNNLLWGQSFWGGYFIIALLELTIVDHFLVRGAGWRSLLMAVIALAVMTEIVFYTAAWGGSTPLVRAIQAGFAYYKATCLPWLSFYLIGVVLAHTHVHAAQTLHRGRWLLLAVGCVTFLLSIGEGALLLGTIHSLALAADYFKLSSLLYELAVIGLFFSLKDSTVRHVSPLAWLATASYGIYYLNDRLILILLALWPALKANALLGQPALLLAGIGLPAVAYYLVAHHAPQIVRLVTFGAALHPKSSVAG